MCDSVRVVDPGEANPQTECGFVAAGWWGRVGLDWKVLAAYGVSFGGDERF